MNIRDILNTTFGFFILLFIVFIAGVLVFELLELMVSSFNIIFSDDRLWWRGIIGLFACPIIIYFLIRFVYRKFFEDLVNDIRRTKNSTSNVSHSSSNDHHLQLFDVDCPFFGMELLSTKRRIVNFLDKGMGKEIYISTLLQPTWNSMYITELESQKIQLIHWKFDKTEPNGTYKFIDTFNNTWTLHKRHVFHTKVFEGEQVVYDLI